MPLATGTKFGPYEILGPLGAGGMGEVYRGRDAKLGRDVALKVLPEQMLGNGDVMARFEREAQVLASLNHPNIAAIYGLEQNAIVMELVEGTTMAGPLAFREALPLIHQLIDGIEYAHEKGIIHRDLKPPNIKLTPEGRVKILDFGLAKAMSTEPIVSANTADSPTLTMRAPGTEVGVIMGTAAYMAPEQARGKAVDKRADIWAFGVVMYELLTGQRLFEGETVSDLLAQTLTKEIDFGKVPPAAQKLLKRCLDREPRTRLRDIGDARLLLLDEEPAARPSSKLPWVLAAAGLAVAAMATLIAWRGARPAEKPLMRLNVDLGLEALADPRNLFALSPDGRRIVYTARTPEGKRLLATRLLDQAKVDFLAGTDNAVDPFFAPDGQWIAFFADGQLKKIPVTGGAPSLIAATSSTPRGGTWLPDGSIVFAASPITGLSRVPAGGGTIQTLTVPKTKGQATHRWPQTTPDGGAILFTAHVRSTQFDEAEIAALDLKSGRWKTVLKGGYFGRYLPSGHLVSVRLGALFGIRFDPGRLETTGLAVPLLDDVSTNLTAAAGRFHFSPENGTFAYVGGKSASADPRPVWLDSSGKMEPALHKGLPSPDGHLIAVQAGTFLNGEIKIWDRVRDLVTSITSNSADSQNPVWAPDGRHLIYRTLVNDQATLWWARADGGAEPRKLLETQGFAIAGSISPDGRHLVYQTLVNGQADLWTLPLDLSDPENPKVGNPEPFFQGATNDIRPQFSPDGRWIAYLSQESGEFAVWVRPFPGPGGRWQLGASDLNGPRWSRAGKQLFIATPDGRVMVCDYETKGDTFIPGKVRQWTETRIIDTVGAHSFEVAPDGRLLTSVNPAESGANPVNVHVTFLLNFFDELKRRLP